MSDLLRMIWAGVVGFLLAIIVTEYAVFEITAPWVKLLLTGLFFALMAFAALSGRNSKDKAHG